MNTLMSPKVVEVLERLFTAAEESETTLEELADSEASRLITSKSGYRQFYGLMKDIPLPVSRETGISALHADALRPGRCPSWSSAPLTACPQSISRPLYGTMAADGLSLQNSSLRKWHAHANTSSRPA